MCRFVGSGTADPFRSLPISATTQTPSSSQGVEPAVAVGPTCTGAICSYQTGVIGGANFWGVGSNLGIAIPGFTAGWANDQWYSNWVGVQNNQNANATFIQIGWQWVNGNTDYVFVEQWTNGNEVYGQYFPQWNLNSGGVTNLTVRLQTSGNNLWYPFVYWGGQWANVGGYFNTGFSANPYGEVIGEGTVQNGAPIPTLPTETNSGNIYIPAGGQNYTNWPAGTASQYAPPYCLYSSTPWTSFETWNDPGNHC